VTGEAFATTFGPADAPLRAFLLHYGGGSALSLAWFAHGAPRTCLTGLLELPGRGTRGGEPFAADYDAAVTDVLETICAFADRPMVLFGHSIGGNIIHSAACRMSPMHRDRLRAVVISAALAPADLSRAAGRQDEPPDASAELLADVRLAGTYVPDRLPTTPVDYHIWFGADDPELHRDHVVSWARHLRREPATAKFSGDHMYITDSMPARDHWRALLKSLA
jgi:surfactin synthase thioesterase subunit